MACRWADVALTGVAVNIFALITAPVLRPDLNVFEDSLSFYAVGPAGILQIVAFVALGVASVTLGIALAWTRPSSFWIALATLLLGISGIASVGLVWFPMGSTGPATMLGDTHQTAGTIGGVAQLAAALAFTLAIRRDRWWSGLFIPAVVLFLIALASALLSQAAIWWPELGIPMGATMRLLVVPLLILWGLVAMRLRRTCERGVTRSAAAR